jgi:integrase
MPLVTFAAVLETLRQTRQLEAETWNNYRRACEKFGNFIGRPASISDLEILSINRWIEFLETQFQLTTVKNIRRDFLVVWHFAADQGLCSDPPIRKIRRVKPPKPIPQAWPASWVQRLICGAESLVGCLQDGTPYSTYAAAMFRLLADTLMRPKDSRLLRWDAIRPNGTVVLIQHKTKRVVVRQLQPATLQALNKLPRLTPNVFWLSKTQCERIVRMTFKAAKISKPAGQSIGHFRHTGGTEIFKKLGSDAAREALGHTPDSRIFEIHYLDPTAKVVPVDSWY